MRAILILAIAALMTIGCNKEESKVTNMLSESEANDTHDVAVTRKGSDEPENKASSAAEESTIDPVLNDYKYPNSALDGKVEMGKTVSYMFLSPDGFAEVVEYYQRIFPDSPPQTGGNAYFVKTDSNGSVTVTLTETDNTTQIILRWDKV